MKYLIFSLLIFFTAFCHAQENREADIDRELHHEVIGDPYLPPSNKSMRIKPAIKKMERVSNTGSAIITTQVNVDGTGNNKTLDAANEPTIAINPLNPDNIVIGWREFKNVFSNFRQAGFSFSTDGGQTWAEGDVIQQGVFRSDPVLDCDSAGNFYYNSLSKDPNGNYFCDVFKSMNGGQAWDNGTPAKGGDKQWMVIDKSGTGNNNIYSFWSSGFSSCYSNNFTRSVNGGLSFDSCEFIAGDPKFGTMDIDDYGALYIGGMRSNANTDSVVVSKCVNPTITGSALWWTPVVIGLDGRYNSLATVNPDGLLGQLNIAADHSQPGQDNIYIAASLSRISNGDRADVMFSRSTDGGQTWSPPVRINDDAGTLGQQWFTTMSVSPNGRIDAVWLDTRDNINIGSDSSALYYSYSYDQGNTWSLNEKLSQSFDPHVGYPNQNKMGDYFDMISENTSAHLAWSNTINGEQDVYYSRITPPLSTSIAESVTPPIKVYPNPFSGDLTISSYAFIKKISVYSITGSITYAAEVNDKTVRIDLSLLSAGLYFVKILFENGAENMRMIVKEDGK